jgi:DNA-binding MarR family transcriptional regulator
MMQTQQRTETVAEFCQSIYELRYRLRKLFQVKLKEANISISLEVLEVMKFLQKQNGLNQQELADMLFKDKSSITYIIDNMVKAGLATRHEDPADRRNKQILLTEKAHRLRQQINPLADACMLALAEDINVADISESLKMLTKMNNSLADSVG